MESATEAAGNRELISRAKHPQGMTPAEFVRFVKERQALARRHGLKEKDMWDAIKRARAKKKLS